MAKRKTPGRGRKPFLKKRTRLSVYVEESQKRKLQRLAKRHGCSEGQLVRDALTAVLGSSYGNVGG